MMQALVCHRLAPDLAGVQLQPVDPPRPGPGEVAITVHAAALNFPDLLMTRGGYQHKPALPYVMGLEGAGVVCALGAGVDGVQPGQPVCFGRKEGAISQQVVMPVAALRPWPRGFDAAEAAAYYVCASTAWVSLVLRGQLRAGEVLLVHGASGGTGAAAVQLGRHLGARVIATGTSGQRLAPLRALGAEQVLTTGGGFRDAVMAFSGSRGADVIFDPVGGDVFDESVRCIAPDGRLLVVGFSGGRIASVATNRVLIKSFSVVGVRAGEYLRNHPEQAPGIVATLARLPEEGAFRPLIGARFALAQALDALRTLQDRRVPGKVVIEMPDIGDTVEQASTPTSGDSP
jgi:NADPH2:quinone reductase